MATRTRAIRILCGALFPPAALLVVLASPAFSGDMHFGLNNLHSNAYDTTYVAPLAAGWGTRNLYPLAQNWLTNGDYQVQLDQAAGLETVFALHSALTIGGDSGFPADTLAWKDALIGIVERYDGDTVNDMPGLTVPCKMWRIEEEWSFWLDSADRYLAYLALSRRAIRAADPTAQVVLVGLGSDAVWRGAYSAGYVSERPPWLGPAPGTTTFDTLLASQYYDVVDVHSYEQRSILSGKLAYVRSLMSDPAKAIVCAEAGGPGLSRAEGYTDTLNARMLVRQTVEALAAGASRYVWPLFPPTPGSDWNMEPWVNMPLMRGSADAYAEKPAYEAHRQMTALLGGFYSVQDLTNRGTGHVLEDDALFDVRVWRGDRSIDVVWCTNRDTTLSLATDASEVRVTHLVTRAGDTAETAEVETLAVAGGSVSIPVGADPLYVEPLTSVTGRRVRAGGAAAAFTVSARHAPGGYGYAIAVAGIPGARVTLDVLGVDGRLVARLLDRAPAAGGSVVAWNGRTRQGGTAPSGAYVIRAASGSATASCKILVVR